MDSTSATLAAMLRRFAAALDDASAACVDAARSIEAQALGAVVPRVKSQSDLAALYARLGPLFNLSGADVLSIAKGPSRSQPHMQVRRQVAIALRAQGLSYTDIGVILNRDHTTAMALCGALKKRR